MLLVEPQPLIERLNPTCRRALERAAGASLTSRHYEVTVEHLLFALVDDPDSDVAVLLAHFRTNTADLRGALQHVLGQQREGNTSNPRFSPILFEWIQDAWLFAATHLQETALRSGALLVRLASDHARYMQRSLAPLDDLPRDELRRDLVRLTSSSAEAGQPTAAAPSAAGFRPDGESALARFTTNLTAAATQGRLDPVYGRDDEIAQVIDVLCRGRKNNPILVGEPGVGKTALVEGLALRIAAGTVPESLHDAQIHVLDLGALKAGAGVRGEFENRLKNVIGEVKASVKPALLFIDEAHTLIGAGGAEGGGDAANLLKPALARGELRTIAATTWREYKLYFEKDAALERRFQPIKVEEPSIDVAIGMLRGLARSFEEKHGVLIRDEAVRAAVKLSTKYLSGRQLPDKAVDLLDTAAAKVKVLRASPPRALAGVRARFETTERELAAYARDFDAGLPIDEDAQAAARARRDDLASQARVLEERLGVQRALVERVEALRADSCSAAGNREPLAAALAELRAIPAEDLLVHADVDEALIGSIISAWTGIPVGRMLKDDVATVLGLEERLRGRVRSQDGALAMVAEELRSARIGLKPPGAPLGVFLLVGSSGVGKTETALALQEALFGDERFLIQLDMGEFQEAHTVSRLFGSPPGYVGFGEGGKLTEAVRQRPYSVVLLDEIEKAHKDILNAFYGLFDKGRLTDGEGRVVDFSNTVVVMTSNLATDALTAAAHPTDPRPSLEHLVDLVRPTLRAHFKPALLARMTVVPYVPLGKDALEEIARSKLGLLAAQAREQQGVEVVIDEEVVAAVAARCKDVDSGARNVEHVLKGAVRPRVSKAILEGLATGTPPARLRVMLGVDGEVLCVSEAA